MDELLILNYMTYGLIFGSIMYANRMRNHRSAYGRYEDDAVGIMRKKLKISPQTVWFFKVLPSLLIPVYCVCFTNGAQMSNNANKAIIGLFIGHYIHRTFIYPFVNRGTKPMAVLFFVFTFSFCVYNGYLQGRYFTEYAVYPDGWVSTPCFQIGVLMFVIGAIINMHADHILSNLRKPGECKYEIPYGGFFEYVSGANFFGEIIEWFGFAIASWSLPGFAFALLTISNIGPRAFHHHQWYKKKFGKKYPQSRKALIPFVV